MGDTVEYMLERYPDLSEEQLDELRSIGLRFCRPVIDNVPEEDKTAGDEAQGDSADAEAAAA